MLYQIIINYSNLNDNDIYICDVLKTFNAVVIPDICTVQGTIITALMNIITHLRHKTWLAILQNADSKNATLVAPYYWFVEPLNYLIIMTSDEVSW